MDEEDIGHVATEVKMGVESEKDTEADFGERWRGIHI